MRLFAQDTARNNLVSWTSRGVKDGYLVGAVISPFSSPVEANGYKQAATKVSERIRAAGGEVWFDSTTYALDMPRTGDFRHYDTWDLWGSDRGELGTPAARADHIGRVFAHQRRLSSPLLAPTTMVAYPDSPQSLLALEMASEAHADEPDSWLTIAGDPSFWQSGAELDAHVGALDQLEPAGWWLVVGRADNAMPPSASPDEIFGLMRTTYALSRDRPVRVAYGDFAALPAVAAGAEAVGTGWDMRQRICAYQDFEQRASGSDGFGSWYQRPSLAGLMGSLSEGEYQVLLSEDLALAQRLAPGTIGTRAEDAFQHHARVLIGIADLQHLGARERCEALLARYQSADAQWPRVRDLTHAKIGPNRWIDPFREGLEIFMRAEGWR